MYMYELSMHAFMIFHTHFITVLRLSTALSKGEWSAWAVYVCFARSKVTKKVVETRRNTLQKRTGHTSTHNASRVIYNLVAVVLF